MDKRFAIAVLGTITLLSGSMAYAKKDKEPHSGGVSPQHMSQSGQSNTNSPVMGQEKGDMRSDARKSDQGMKHENETKKDSKGKAKGHSK